ncbi:MAG: transcriptional activator NhaR [Arenicellales bacterium]|jgi:LysR family transcriptional activator of nhaA
MQNLRINLKHLRYFWAVASHGSITKASQALHLTPQTISGQLRDLEESIGEKLFGREGRNLVLTETGRMVFSYADEMFQLGIELQDVLDGQTFGIKVTVKFGVAMIVPKLLAYRVLEPVLQMNESTNLICHEAPLVDLLADMSIHKLDAVLSDCPINPSLNIRAYNHPLGGSGITFFSVPEHAKKLKKNFPENLHDFPFLMPSKSSSLRMNLENWFDQHAIKPRVVAEFEDRALMKAFGERGTGVFTSPQTMEEDVLEKYGVRVIGRTDEVQENFYLISPERRIRNPAVTAITEAARANLFS